MIVSRWFGFSFVFSQLYIYAACFLIKCAAPLGLIRVSSVFKQTCQDYRHKESIRFFSSFVITQKTPVYDIYVKKKTWLCYVKSEPNSKYETLDFAILTVNVYLLRNTLSHNFGHDHCMTNTVNLRASSEENSISWYKIHTQSTCYHLDQSLIHNQIDNARDLSHIRADCVTFYNDDKRKQMALP